MFFQLFFSTNFLSEKFKEYEVWSDNQEKSCYYLWVMDPGGEFFDQPNKIKTFKIVSYVISFWQ